VFGYQRVLQNFQPGAAGARRAKQASASVGACGVARSTESLAGSKFFVCCLVMWVV
jgi:hypothetical protein